MEIARTPRNAFRCSLGTVSYTHLPDFIEVVETISLPYNMLRRNRKYFCVKVRGESMSPTSVSYTHLLKAEGLTLKVVSV